MEESMRTNQGEKGREIEQSFYEPFETFIFKLYKQSISP